MLLANQHVLRFLSAFLCHRGDGPTVTGALIGLALAVFGGGGVHTAWNGLTKTGSVPLLGVVCLALVGLEIGPGMGDEVHDLRRTFSRAIPQGGALCARADVGSTMSLTLAVPPAEMAVFRADPGSGQNERPTRAQVDAAPLTILLIASVIGSASAWASGSARILFVCGFDRYLPRALGKVLSHP